MEANANKWLRHLANVPACTITYANQGPRVEVPRQRRKIIELVDKQHDVDESPGALWVDHVISIVVMEARIAQARPFVGNTRTYINYPFGQFVHDPAVNHPVR